MCVNAVVVIHLHLLSVTLSKIRSRTLCIPAYTRIRHTTGIGHQIRVNRRVNNTIQELDTRLGLTEGLITPYAMHPAHTHNSSEHNHARKHAYVPLCEAPACHTPYTMHHTPHTTHHTPHTTHYTPRTRAQINGSTALETRVDSSPHRAKIKRREAYCIVASSIAEQTFESRQAHVDEHT